MTSCYQTSPWVCVEGVSEDGDGDAGSDDAGLDRHSGETSWTRREAHSWASHFGVRLIKDTNKTTKGDVNSKICFK